MYIIESVYLGPVLEEYIQNLFGLVEESPSVEPSQLTNLTNLGNKTI